MSELHAIFMHYEFIEGLCTRFACIPRTLLSSHTPLLRLGECMPMFFKWERKIEELGG